MDRPLVVSHRGKTPGSAAENSLAAIQDAAAAGADLVELDVRLSLDRHAVVLHDAFLGRTTAGHGWVRLYPSFLLHRLRLRRSPAERVPLLDDLLPSIPPGVQPALHLKDAGALGAVLRAVERSGDPSRTWLWLDRLDHVQRAVGRFPTIRCTYLPTEARTPAELTTIFARVRGTGAAAVGVDADQVDASLVAGATAHGLRLFAMLYDWQWDLLPGLVAAGIGGIISDDPARVRASFSARATHTGGDPVKVWLNEGADT
jgi:glycerophosphoryl diester phosphodiesterase